MRCFMGFVCFLHTLSLGVVFTSSPSPDLFSPLSPSLYLTRRYNLDSHPAELTAGYYNTDNNNAYLSIAQVLPRVLISFLLILFTA